MSGQVCRAAKPPWKRSARGCVKKASVGEGRCGVGPPEKSIHEQHAVVQRACYTWPCWVGRQGDPIKVVPNRQRHHMADASAWRCQTSSALRKCLGQCWGVCQSHSGSTRPRHLGGRRRWYHRSAMRARCQEVRRSQALPTLCGRPCRHVRVYRSKRQEGRGVDDGKGLKPLSSGFEVVKSKKIAGGRAVKLLVDSRTQL